MNQESLEQAAKEAAKVEMGVSYEPHMSQTDESYIEAFIDGANWQRDNGWVSVEERLPDNTRWVQVQIIDEIRAGHHILPHTYDNGIWYEYGRPNIIDYKVTHWKDFTDLLLPPQTI